MGYASGIMKGNYLGIVFLAIWIGLWIFYSKGMKKRKEELLREEM